MGWIVSKFQNTNISNENSTIVSMLSSPNKFSFLNHIKKLLKYNNITIKDNYLANIPQLILVDISSVAEKIKWIEELKCCIVEFYELELYPTTDNIKNIPIELKNLEIIGKLYKKIYWEMNERNLNDVTLSCKDEDMTASVELKNSTSNSDGTSSMESLEHIRSNSSGTNSMESLERIRSNSNGSSSIESLEHFVSNCNNDQPYRLSIDNNNSDLSSGEIESNKNTIEKHTNHTVELNNIILNKDMLKSDTNSTTKSDESVPTTKELENISKNNTINSLPPKPPVRQKVGGPPLKNENNAKKLKQTEIKKINSLDNIKLNNTTITSSTHSLTNKTITTTKTTNETNKFSHKKTTYANAKNINELDSDNNSVDGDTTNINDSNSTNDDSTNDDDTKNINESDSNDNSIDSDESCGSIEDLLYLNQTGLLTGNPSETLSYEMFLGPDVNNFSYSNTHKNEFNTNNNINNTIRTYRNKFINTPTNIDSKQQTILNSPCYYATGESPQIKKYIINIVRHCVLDYFLNSTPPPPPPFKFTSNNDNRIDILSILIEKNPLFINYVIQDWFSNFLIVFECQKKIIKSSPASPWLYFEKSLIPSLISRTIGQNTFLELMEKTTVTNDYLESKLIGPISKSILTQLKHPLFYKTMESYHTPKLFEKYELLKTNVRVPESFFIEAGIIKTNDERFDNDISRKNFLESIANETFIQQESMIFSNNYREKILTLFEFCDDIFEDILDECIDEINEYMQ